MPNDQHAHHLPHGPIVIVADTRSTVRIIGMGGTGKFLPQSIRRGDGDVMRLVAIRVGERPRQVVLVVFVIRYWIHQRIKTLVGPGPVECRRRTLEGIAPPPPSSPGGRPMDFGPSSALLCCDPGDDGRSRERRGRVGRQEENCIVGTYSRLNLLDLYYGTPRGACCTGDVHRLSHRNAILDDLGVVGNEERCDNAREHYFVRYYYDQQNWQKINDMCHQFESVIICIVGIEVFQSANLIMGAFGDGL